MWFSQEFLVQLSESLVFYSDGSYSNQGAGYGIYCPSYDLRASGSLGKYCSISQAELIAVTRCAIEATYLDGINNNIIICTDSKFVLNSLNNPLTNSKLVKDCKKFINLLCIDNKVTIMWVPAHCDVAGNEIADGLAKDGSRSSFIGPEPVVPLTLGYGKITIRNTALLVLKQAWVSTDTCRKAKYFMSEPNSSNTKYALSLKKNNLRILVSVLTGHGRFKSHLNRMGLADDCVCDDCLENDDDNIHFIGSCPAFDNSRSQFLNCRSIPTHLLSSLPWFKLLQFAKDAERICVL